MEKGLYLYGKLLTVLSLQDSGLILAYTVDKVGGDCTNTKSTVYPPISYFGIARARSLFPIPLISKNFLTLSHYLIIGFNT